MKTTFLKSLTGVTATMLLAGYAGAQSTPEVEPNNTKATATPATLVNIGDTLTGLTTGTTTTGAGTANADFFRVKTAAAALGIYRHRLVVTTTGTAGHSAALMGVPAAGTASDLTTVQTSSTASTPARMSQWYGFGKEEEIFFRMQGASGTTGNYTATYDRQPVTAIAGPTVVDGAITISTYGQGHSNDTEIFLFDSNFNLLRLSDDAPAPLTGTQSQLTQTLAPGNYYIAVSNFNTATSAAVEAGDRSTGAARTDFPNVMTNSNTTAAVNCGLVINDPLGSFPVAATKAAAYDIVFVAFTVIQNTQPTNPTGVATRNPSGTVDAGSNVQLNVQVTPGVNPTSTNLAVSADTTSLGGGVISLFDDGLHGDGAAGDNNFGASVTPSAAGSYTVPFTIVDGESRTSGGNFPALNVRTAPPSCPPGIEAQSFTGLNSDGLAGTATNSVQTFTFTSSDPVLALHISGRCYAQSTATYRSEAQWRITPPGGAAFNVQPNTTTGGGWDTFDVVDRVVPIPGNIVANAGTWTIETFESFNDSGLDAKWNLCIALEPNNQPTPPVVTGVAVEALAGAATLLRANVAPGINPTSTGITVTGDLTAIGGAPAQALYDDGTNGDATAGDNVFSYLYTMPSGTAVGSYTVALTATDAQSRSGNGTIAIRVDDALNTVAGAGTFTGDTITGGIGYGNDVDMWKIYVCDPATFSATVATGGGTLGDSQLFMFRADGTGVAFNDDQASSALSKIDGPIVQALTPGEYYIAISDYNTDALSSGGLIWANSPFTGVRSPDGPGAAGALASWDTGGGDTGTYTIVLTGGNGTGCAPATGNCCLAQYCQVLTEADCSTQGGVWGGAGSDCSTSPCASNCGSQDFNHDGDSGTDHDIEAFFACLGGTCCATCDTSDFNGDGDIGTDQDIEAFFRVLGGSAC